MDGVLEDSTKGPNDKEKKQLSWGHRYVCSVCECRVKINSYHTTAPLRGGLERQWYRKSSQSIELQKMYLVMLFVWNKKWLKIGIYAGLRPRQMAYLMCQEPEGEKLEDHE